MAGLPLPQTSTQGGPNPNSDPNYAGVSVLDNPGPALAPALTGDARASMAALLRARTAQALGGSTYQPPGAGPGMGSPSVPLPAYNASDPSLVATPANGVMGQGTGLTNMVESGGAQGAFDDRLSALRNQAPGVPEAIGNFLFNKAGGSGAQAYDQKNYAGDVYSRPETQQYFSAHPSLLAAAEKDPVNFAMKLGPMLDASVATLSGTAQPGSITHQTIDGPMVKPDDNTAQTAAYAKAFGISDQHAHAVSQPHHYTLPEFLHATEGLPIGALKNMWEMQHYLSPQQQALSRALATAQHNAQLEYEQNGHKPGSAQALFDQITKIAGGVLPALYGIQNPATQGQ